MPLFRIRRSPSSEQVPTPTNGDRSEQIRATPTRREIRNQALSLLEDSESQQTAFATEAVAQGLTDDQITAAAAAAINNNAFPRFFRGTSMLSTDSPIPVMVLRGPVPPEALWVNHYGRNPTVATIYGPFGRETPTIDTVADPKRDFYVETHLIHKEDRQTTAAALAGTVALMDGLRVQDSE